MIERRMRFAKWLVAVGIGATLAHFADNALFMSRYPGPAWITPLGVIAAWCVVTLVAIVALTRSTADAMFFAAGALYSLILLGGLVHYAFSAPMHMPLRSNATVIGEGILGVALAASLVMIAIGVNRRSRSTS